jgi:hypothetical protein
MVIRGLSVTFQMECNQPQKQGRVIRRARAVALWLLLFENTYLLAKSNIRPSPAAPAQPPPLEVIGLFRSRTALEAEIVVLRHQLNVLRRKSAKRLAFGNIDRLVFTALYRAAPGVLDALKIIKPQTVIRWHRAGFRTYWR